MRKKLSKEGRKLLKDVIIGVITTVIGATLIYFLGFHDKKTPLTKPEREEIAADSWKTYVTVENIYIDNSASLMQEAIQTRDFAGIAEEASAASKKFQTSLEDLTKTEGLDKDFLTFLKSRVKTDKIQAEETGKFYTDLLTVTGNGTHPLLPDSLKSRFSRFAEATTFRFIQTAPAMETLTSKLSRKYNQLFNINELRVIQAAKYRKMIFNPVLEKKNDSLLPPGEPANNGGKKENKKV